MPAITSLGIGSGLDLNTMLTQLVALESKPLTQLRNDASALQSKVSTYGQISSLFSAVQTASSKLSGSTLWSQSTATSADTSVAQVVSSSNAAPGSYAVTVQQLATNQSVVATSSFSSTDSPAGAGTLTLDIGSWDLPPMNFVPQVGRESVEINVTASDTLSSLRDKINATGAGVTASIVTDSSGSRLALRSTVTGQANGFRLSANDADGNNTDASGLSRFAFDPEHGTTLTEQKVAAQNAKATVNGIDVSSATNDLSSVIEGVTLRLGKVSDTGTTLNVSADTDSVKGAVQDFAKAYNALVSFLGSQTKFDATSKVGGPLQGDSAATGLINQLRTLVGSSTGASSTFARLSDIGMAVQRDGTLSVDSTKLASAVGNLSELKKAFANNGNGNSANDGFARRYANLATQVLGSDGTLTSRTEGLQTRITKNSDAQSRMQDRITRFQARLTAQYAAMDANQSKLNALSTYVTQQMNALTAMANKTN